jgi:hypothetical protein
MRAEDFEVRKDKINWARVFYHTQMWLTFLFVIWVVSLVFRSEKMVDVGDYTAAQYDTAGKRLAGSLKDGVPGRFTSEEATAGLIQMLKINGKRAVQVPDSAMDLQGASVRFQEDKVTVVLRTAMVGIPHYNVIVLRVTEGSDGGTPKYTIVSTRIGKFPFIGPLRRMLLERFELIFRVDDTGCINSLQYLIQKAKIKDGEAEITAKKYVKD